MEMGVAGSSLALTLRDSSSPCSPKDYPRYRRRGCLSLPARLKTRWRWMQEQAVA